MTYQFKIQLRGITQPPVWRRILVPAEYTFYNLHCMADTLNTRFRHSYQQSWKEKHSPVQGRLHPHRKIHNCTLFIIQQSVSVLSLNIWHCKVTDNKQPMLPWFLPFCLLYLQSEQNMQFSSFLCVVRFLPLSSFGLLISFLLRHFFFFYSLVPKISCNFAPRNKKIV